ncbi:MAG: class I SAM-dependent methyltransferase [Polyangiaceae bacterium]|nr:class I SAM-dependent methyltransferase [Polyangiaceae bacterium]
MEFDFDEAFYQRHYLDPETRVIGPDEVFRLAKFVTGYLEYLDVDVRDVLDLGCGIGLWRDALRTLAPEASYHGVETSGFLCERYGWERGSITELDHLESVDLVVCQGVLQYLTATEATKAIRSLARLTTGALYLEVLTREDWEENCAQDRTDGAVHLRKASWYRRLLGPRFIAVGGGLFLPRDTHAVLYELEKLG